MNEDKVDLRKQLMRERDAMSVAEVLEKSDAIFKKLKRCRHFRKAKGVLLYSSYKNEVHTRKIIDRLEKQGINIFLPVIIGNHEFIARRNSGKFERNQFGIDEPVSHANDFEGIEDLDTVVCPGVGFDWTLNRIGFGKGFYDRFLNRPGLYKIGLCYEFQMVDTVYPEAHDIPMDVVVTEEHIYRRRR